MGPNTTRDGPLWPRTVTGSSRSTARSSRLPVVRRETAPRNPSRETAFVTAVPARYFDDALNALRTIVGREQVVTDREVAAGYCVDWTGRFRGATPAVVRPGNTEEVAAVVRICTTAGLAVVPQGGNTGLVGGSVPLGGEVVVSLRRLDDLGEVDLRAAQVTVGAGATLAAVQALVRPLGLAVGVDLAPRDSCTIGGMV